MTTINGNSMPMDKVPQVIQDQPGYSGEGSYIVTKSTSGGYRLYKAVGSNWMDASLQDNDDLSGFSMDTAAALGRKGGSVKSDKKRKSSAENGKRGGRPKKMV